MSSVQAVARISYQRSTLETRSHEVCLNSKLILVRNDYGRLVPVRSWPASLINEYLSHLKSHGWSVERYDTV